MYCATKQKLLELRELLPLLEGNVITAEEFAKQKSLSIGLTSQSGAYTNNVYAPYILCVYLFHFTRLE